MALMGYVPGSGLGKDGSGRVEPVPAYVYPAGVSLGEHLKQIPAAIVVPTIFEVK